MADTAIVVINAYNVIAGLEEQYIREHTTWGNQCAIVRRGFRQKTSRSVKNDKEYESTIWYKVNLDGSLESVGKEEPDYSKYYPPEPKPTYSFKFQRYQDHIILEEKDYTANQTLFRACLAFALEECRNYIHPLYANPDKALKGDSVRKGGVSSVGSQISGGTEKERRLGCKCWNEGDCEMCSRSDDCPENSEDLEED